jgi:hypothetical protein
MKPITENVVAWQVVAALSVVTAIMFDNRLIVFLCGVFFVCAVSLAHTAKKLQWLRGRERFFNSLKYTERDLND